MDKQFVPYNLSVELKKLGFDEPVLAWYYGSYPKQLTFENPYNYRNYEDAPLRQQAIRFLLNKIIELEIGNYADITIDPAFAGILELGHTEISFKNEIELIEILTNLVKNGKNKDNLTNLYIP